MYVVDRWLAEEQDRPDNGMPLDEQSVDHLWNEKTEKELRNLRADALRTHKKVIQQNAFNEILKSTPWLDYIVTGAGILFLSGPWKLIKSTLKQMTSGVLGAIGVILFASAVLSLSDGLQTAAREAVGSLLPTEEPPEVEETKDLRYDEGVFIIERPQQ